MPEYTLADGSTAEIDMGGWGPLTTAMMDPWSEEQIREADSAMLLELLVHGLRCPTSDTTKWVVDCRKKALLAFLPCLQLRDRHHNGHGPPGPFDDELLAFVINLFEKLAEIFACFKRCNFFDHVSGPHICGLI